MTPVLVSSTPTVDRWTFVPRARPGARMRLLCLPHAGGGAYAYRGWPAYLPDSIEVCAIQLPGRENRLRERPIGVLSTLIDQLLEALCTRLDLPVAVFGHSMGALVGFELARGLRREYGITPVHLLVSGRVAPTLPPRHRPMHAESDEAFIARLRQFNGTAEEVLNNVELMELLLPTLKADFQLNEAYTYVDEPPLSCPISVFGGADDHIVPFEQMAGWRNQTTDRYTERKISGGHFFVHTAAERVCQAIAQDVL